MSGPARGAKDNKATFKKKISQGIAKGRIPALTVIDRFMNERRNRLCAIGTKEARDPLKYRQLIQVPLTPSTGMLEHNRVPFSLQPDPFISK